ncbi:MAG: TIGR01212 family radical SAM protein [Deltaproteobacteria bacterium]|nr:TIGR01212 family radical SAM protein [Deltaproteobacteria bacterium]
MGGRGGRDTPGMGIKEQLERGMEYIRRRHKADRFIAYLQINTNTYAPLEALKGVYQEAIGHPDVVALAISTRPDCVDEGVIELLSELSKEKYLWLELGLQSSRDKTLELINRGHTVKDFVDAVKMTKEKNIPVCAHIILGLPGETQNDMLDTARFLAGLNIWGIKIHNIQVHKGTELEEMYNKGGFQPLGLDEYIELVVDILEVLPPGMVIHRLCGDTPRRFLVAPEWGVNKGLVLERIHQLMEERKTYQGAKYVNPR